MPDLFRAESRAGAHLQEHLGAPQLGTSRLLRVLAWVQALALLAGACGLWRWEYAPQLQLQGRVLSAAEASERAPQALPVAEFEGVPRDLIAGAELLELTLSDLVPAQPAWIVEVNPPTCTLDGGFTVLVAWTAAPGAEPPAPNAVATLRARLAPRPAFGWILGESAR